MNFPEELKYSKDHEWVRVEGEVAFVGITDFAQSELGDIVFVDVPNVGETMAAGEVFGTVEAIKTVSDLMLPVGGEILELNAELDENPVAVNSDPYGAGWMIRVKMSDPAELESLMSAADYRAMVGK